MTQVTVTETLRSLLPDLSQPLEFCDASGRVLARVMPVFDSDQYEPWEPSFDEEELRQQGQSGKWYTTAEVLAHPKRLEGS